MKVIKEIDFLKQKCESASTEEAEEIKEKLFDTLDKHENGVGLAANQIGIQKRVCVINVTEPICLVNPKIIDLDTEIPYVEGCLSFPGQQVRTKRYAWVTIDTDNLGKVMFGPPDVDENGMGDPRLLESVVVQHEIDHLNGITMFDRENKTEPVETSKKYGRNDKVTVENPNTGEVKENIKYKKIERLLNDGWEIREN